MSTRRTWIVVFLGSLMCAASSGLCEVSAVVTADHASGFVLMSQPDGPDPWPVFARVRVHVEPEFLLNESGDLNGDGAPSAAIDPVTGRPEVAWARWDGGDYEIAVSRWDGAGWTLPELLTDNDVDDVDPAIAFAPDGSRRIVWWRMGWPGQVWWTERPVNQPHRPEEQVSIVIDGGVKPCAVEHAGAPRVVYQVEAAGVTRLVAARRSAEGWQREIVHETTYAGPNGDGDLRASVHSAAGQLWVAWTNGPGLVGFRTYDEATETWSSTQTEPYAWGDNGESEPVAREMAEVRIRLRVLGP